MRIPAPAPPDFSLADLPIGVPGRIVAIDRVAAERLAAHGFRPGAALRVEQRAPFGGPRIVRLGSARIAIATVIARSIRVRPETPPPPRP
jgi:Fe2+ transport system protein FeoA